LLAVALLLPLAALGLYFGTGHYDDLALYRDIAASRQGVTDAATETRITRALKKHSENHPDDLTSRYALAQRLMVSGDMQGAVDAYRYVAEREPEAAGVRAELAQAMFFARGSKMDAEISGLVDRVLQAQPENGTALGLAGIAAFERGEHRAARDYWQRALDQLSPGSAAAQALEAGVARAEKALADAGEPVEPAAAKSEQPAAGPAITVRVTLAGGVDAEPDTPVFIYARGTDGPMPLAIVRLSAGQLPAEVVLDESRAMMPNRSIVGVDEVQLVARLAVRGDARPAPGDWQGEIDSLPKSKWDQPQRIAIDRKL
ncbi:tetratricopeptide repeat protein, partial [Microbulbifer halophilus]